MFHPRAVFASYSFCLSSGSVPEHTRKLLWRGESLNLWLVYRMSAYWWLYIQFLLEIDHMDCMYFHKLVFLHSSDIVRYQEQFPQSTFLPCLQFIAKSIFMVAVGSLDIISYQATSYRYSIESFAETVSTQFEDSIRVRLHIHFISRRYQTIWLCLTRHR